ncbi:UvrD-helicase domain-containing protein [Shigella flexneri]
MDRKDQRPGQKKRQTVISCRSRWKILPAFLRRLHEGRGKPRDIHCSRRWINCLQNHCQSAISLITRALAEIRETVAREKRRRGELGFDDMLSRLDSALRSESGEVLAAAIRTRFPVAMIDEFQDTDPQQYRIFRRIWHHQPETALLLIGDPKQAIYAFRGADIFTYMKARSEVHAHYTLDTNWRSAPGMVNSVNKLFSQTDDTFMFREIPFIPVKSAGKNQALRFVFKGETQPAMKMWLMEGESCGVGDYQSTMAQVCAAQIRDWLQAGQRGEALLMNGDDARPVRASDISVLVRSRPRRPPRCAMP